jgi:hypothetical protein
MSTLVQLPIPVQGYILWDFAWLPRGSVKNTSPMCHSHLQNGLRKVTYDTLGLGCWSTVCYLFRDRPATRTGPRLSATRRRARQPLKPQVTNRYFSVSMKQNNVPDLLSQHDLFTINSVPFRPVR